MTDQAVQNGQDPNAAQAAALHALSLEVTQALLQATLVAAQKAAVATDTREIDEGAKAALNFAQAIVLLDPTLSTDGTPLEHQLALEQLKGKNALEQAKQRAAAPTPAKSVTVRRDQQGRASGYQVSGG